MIKKINITPIIPPPYLLMIIFIPLSKNYFAFQFPVCTRERKSKKNTRFWQNSLSTSFTADLRTWKLAGLTITRKNLTSRRSRSPRSSIGRSSTVSTFASLSAQRRQNILLKLAISNYSIVAFSGNKFRLFTAPASRSVLLVFKQIKKLFQMNVTDALQRHYFLQNGSNLSQDYKDSFIQ